MKKLIIILIFCSSCAKQLHEPKVYNKEQIVKEAKEKQEDKKRRNVGIKVSIVLALAIFFTAQELKE